MVWRDIIRDTDWSTMFWAGGFVVFIFVITGLVAFLVVGRPEPCVEDYVLVDPRIAAISFGLYLEQEGLEEMGATGRIYNFYWGDSKDGLRFYLEFEDRTWVGKICYIAKDQSIDWRKLEVIYHEPE